MSNPQNMIACVLFQFPNGKSHPGRIEKYKVRHTEKCKGSHRKLKKAFIHCNRNQSQNIVPHEILPDINLPQARVSSHKNSRDRKMHSPKPGCYDHMICEI